jgi:hypothetical protein
MLGRAVFIILGTVAMKAVGKQLEPEKEKAKEALGKAKKTYSNNMEDVEEKQKELNKEKKDAKKNALFKGMKEGLKSFVLDENNTKE